MKGVEVDGAFAAHWEFKEKCLERAAQMLLEQNGVAPVR